ncbi:hypothetical protein [Flavobacterium foetidum]|uniref:hypothetical protein n=1 Tax=Flavobacterium foetidum TaxID=2026681 RepID=UPI0010755E73|nr:hypothetical protein [Flavobacterium foetidum]KAF2513876.1 hypothetical protein E0W73_13695 [Flavobacterium foetidum]
MQSQIDSVNIQGVMHCNKEFLDIIKKDKKTITYFMPDDFVCDSVKFKMDSSYVTVENKLYLQRVYCTNSFKFKTLTDKANKVFYIHNLVNNQKRKIEFTEPCEITFKGVKLNNNVIHKYYFRAFYDIYGQNFSLALGEKERIIINRDFAEYPPCKQTNSR